jgi:hypothetical protein
MRRYTAPLAFALALLATCCMAGAWAQRPSALPLAGDPSPMSGRFPPQSVTDDQLHRFMDAAQRVSLITKEYTPRVKAEARDDQARLQQEADDKMVDAVHESGLTVDEFNGIGQAIQDDASLKQRIRGMNPASP